MLRVIVFSMMMVLIISGISGEKLQTLTDDKHAIFVNIGESSYKLKVVFNDEVNKQDSLNIAEQLIKQVVH
ncbi:hypothetical protein [Virgibacillus litoralis]|nr:hypothetical protein [Virgibacillus litoralis]